MTWSSQAEPEPGEHLTPPEVLTQAGVLLPPVSAGTLTERRSHDENARTAAEGRERRFVLEAEARNADRMERASADHAG